MRSEHVTEQEKWFFYRGRPLPVLYREYLQYLRQVKGVTTGTIHNRKKPLLLFLMKMPKFSTPVGIKRLKPRDIHDYVIETAQPLRREGKRCLTIALRDFFRFLHLNGHTATDLSKSVPTIIAYRLTSLHRGLSWKVVRQLLQVPDRRTHRGRRDFAIILMLARYGIRQRQLTELRLSDIDWKKAQIHFKAVKGGKDILVPLFPDVAKALLAYFKGGRQEAPKKYDNVFLTTGTGGSLTYGQRPLASSLWGTVSRYLKCIGIDRACEFPRGPHAIRHAFATKLLEENQPIKTISDLLGHKSIHTTFVYTKSDINRLRELAGKWPEGREKKEAA